MDRCANRLHSLYKHIEDNKSNLDFIESIHRLSAVDHAIFDTYSFTPAKACMISHRNAIMLAKEEGWNSVLVVEDDARFTPNAKQTFNSLTLAFKSIDWSILFGASMSFQQRGFRKLKVGDAHLLELKSEGTITGTHCVLYNSKYYDKIIDLINREIQSDSPHHLDMLLSLNLNHIYLTIPYLALFTENDIHDILTGKHTKRKYQNIIQSQQRACEM